ncbi:MAG: hypothetical protein FJX34_03090 [Alphaproteobacteria bacterium]|nr:hypothetical protein [Alphaproteobacteria bacterium]
MRFFILFCFLNLSAVAQELQNLNSVGNFQDWSLFRTGNLCYLISTPISSSGNFNKRGEAFFLVTGIKNDADEISTTSGFLYKNNSEAELSFGSKKFYLFPHQAFAWAHDKSSDINIIKEMQKNTDMVVTGIAKDGKLASDTYSLIGFSQAYADLKKICK